ncbi:MAG: hypothetical protein PR2021_6700 [Candidatus Phytoplasma pruni]|uniref:hypothetical protein n=1 Tax=Poinsettia branch-inducing phytoplasma TaxID=138647 RepID=UPI00035DFA52|nr:hypothetical protein [Poinsettia branch-inducing phytoplasma]WEK82735.1 MAG: hypothetical protein PR2021_6700 [Candidatus Phytoplasma pruni]
MNQKKIYHNIKDLFVYYLTISSDQSKNQNLEKIFSFYVIKLSDKVTKMFTLYEIDQNIDLFQEQLELCLQTGDLEFFLQEKEINIILLFLESFYFAAEKMMILEKEKYALFLLEAEKKNKNLFETEEHKRKLKKNLN